MCIITGSFCIWEVENHLCTLPSQSDAAVGNVLMGKFSYKRNNFTPPLFHADRSELMITSQSIQQLCRVSTPYCSKSFRITPTSRTTVPVVWVNNLHCNLQHQHQKQSCMHRKRSLCWCTTFSCTSTGPPPRKEAA